MAMAPDESSHSCIQHLLGTYHVRSVSGNWENREVGLGLDLGEIVVDGRRRGLWSCLTLLQA